MNHFKITLQILVLFFGFTAYPNAVCILLQKDVSKRTYSFKCNNQTVNVQCEDEDKFLCGVTIKDAFETMKFNISEDQIKAFDLFSTAELAKTTCDTSKKLCTRDGNTCSKYKKYFQKAEQAISGSPQMGKRCDPVNLGESVQAMGAFSSGLAADFNFGKNSCGASSDVPFNSLKNKLAVLRKVLEPSLNDRDSLLYNCASLSGKYTSADRDSFVASKKNQLLDLKNRITSRVGSTSDLKELACGPQSGVFFVNDKLDIETVMCAIIEESALSMSDKAISCEEKVGDYLDTDTDSRTAREAGAALAKADAVPLEQKPMPEIMASQVGKPIGLTPALAQVDQVAPGSGTVQGSTPSESNIAAGAVRDTFPNTAAIQAGQAFAPVYEKLSNMANAVSSSSSSSSGRTGTIGRSTSPNPTSGASGIATVSRKLPAAKSDSTIDPSALVGAAAATGAVVVGNSDTDSDKATKAAGLKRSTAGDAEVAPVGGPRPINLGSSRSAGRGGTAANVAAGAANSEAVVSEALATVQKKITQLDTPAKVISFFKEEAIKIPDFRSLLYSDATSAILAEKGIRVVNQRGGVSGESVTNAKYVFRDDGTKFTKLNIGKKN